MLDFFFVPFLFIGKSYSILWVISLKLDILSFLKYLPDEKIDILKL